jgi:hypothetical protein
VQEGQIASVAAATDLLRRLRKFRDDAQFYLVDEARKTRVKDCAAALNGWVSRKEHFLEWKKHLQEMKNDMLTLHDSSENQERAWAFFNYLSQDPEVLASLPADNRNAMCQVLLSLDHKQYLKKLGSVVKRRLLAMLEKANSIGNGRNEDETGTKFFSASQTKQLKMLLERYQRTPAIDERTGYESWYGRGTPTPPRHLMSGLMTPDTPYYREYGYPPPMPPVPAMPLDMYLNMAQYDFNGQFLPGLVGLPHPDIGLDGQLGPDLEHHLHEFQFHDLMGAQGQLWNGMAWTGSGDPRVAALLRQIGLEKYDPVLANAEIDWESLLLMTDSDLAELGLPKGARSNVRRALRRLNVLSREDGKEEEPELPVGQSPSAAKAKMSHLQIGTEDDSASPNSLAMPSLDSLKSIWNTPTGVATPYGQLRVAPYRQEAPQEEAEDQDGARRKPHVMNASAAEFVPAPSPTKQLNPKLELESALTPRSPSPSVPRTPPPHVPPPAPA